MLSSPSRFKAGTIGFAAMKKLTGRTKERQEKKKREAGDMN